MVREHILRTFIHSYIYIHACIHRRARTHTFTTHPAHTHQAAGIKRIVSRHHTSLENCSRAAHELGISWGLVKDTPQGFCVCFARGLRLGEGDACACACACAAYMCVSTCTRAHEQHWYDRRWRASKIHRESAGRRCQFFYFIFIFYFYFYFIFYFYFLFLFFIFIFIFIFKLPFSKK